MASPSELQVLQAIELAATQSSVSSVYTEGEINRFGAMLFGKRWAGDRQMTPRGFSFQPDLEYQLASLHTQGSVRRLGPPLTDQTRAWVFWQLTDAGRAVVRDARLT